jgi:hypothetical protein
MNFSLIRGDTMILPPLTIHFLISVTNALISGGSWMRKQDVRATINAWRWDASGKRVLLHRRQLGLYRRRQGLCARTSERTIE